VLELVGGRRQLSLRRLPTKGARLEIPSEVDRLCTSFRASTTPTSPLIRPVSLRESALLGQKAARTLETIALKSAGSALSSVVTMASPLVRSVDRSPRLKASLVVAELLAPVRPSSW